MMGRVEKYLLEEIEARGAIHITLIDPENVDLCSGSEIAVEAEASNTTAIMIGGSTLVLSSELDSIVKSIKESVKVPIILFPNNITGISKYADAIWFMSLLNSSDPYYIVGAQMLAAPIIKRYNLEVIPLGYLIVGGNSTVSIIGKANAIPYDKSQLAVAYALAAQYLGMRFVYLEAGSGAKIPVNADMIRSVKENTEVRVVVGGGITTAPQAKEIAEAGADIIVTGTMVEKAGFEPELGDIVNSISGCRRRRV